MAGRNGGRLVRGTGRLVQVLRGLNGIAALVALLALLATVAAEPQLATRLAAKYGDAADLPTMLSLLRVLIAMILPSAWVVERLLRALGGIIANVRDGAPFAPVNADHLRTIGWMLLALQLLDLALGGLTYAAARIGVDFATWQPSLTGWLAALVAFVLVRVFATGTAMRDDLAGTV